jgi:hypothetical protein
VPPLLLLKAASHARKRGRARLTNTSMCLTIWESVKASARKVGRSSSGCESGKGKSKDSRMIRGRRILDLRQYFAAAAPRLNEDTSEGKVITSCMRRCLHAARKQGIILSHGTQFAKALVEGARTCLFTRAMAKLAASFPPTQKGVVIRKVFLLN